MHKMSISAKILLFFEVFEVGIVEIDESSDNHGTILIRIPSQNSTWKSPQKTILANIGIYNLLRSLRLGLLRFILVC